MMSDSSPPQIVETHLRGGEANCCDAVTLTHADEGTIELTFTFRIPLIVAVAAGTLALVDCDAQAATCLAPDH